MRIRPNQPRLRIVALLCWALSAAATLWGDLFTFAPSPLFALGLGLPLLAIGIAFWLLGTDHQAGIIFDRKGLVLNLGHSSSFIAWENIEQVGVSGFKPGLLTLGSRRQFGVILKDIAPYVQSYEQRLPASRGRLSGVIQRIEGLLRPLRRSSDAPLLAQLEANRSSTGFDVLVPEAFLGNRADRFARLVESYRSQPAPRRGGGGMAYAG